jgi:hypothetical protein
MARVQGAETSLQAEQAIAVQDPSLGLGRRSFVWAQADGERGARAAVLSLGEGYAFAAAAMVEVAERLATFDRVGVFTPGASFGPDLVLALPGVSRRDLPAAGVAS